MTKPASISSSGPLILRILQVRSPFDICCHSSQASCKMGSRFAPSTPSPTTSSVPRACTRTQSSHLHLVQLSLTFQVTYNLLVQWLLLQQGFLLTSSSRNTCTSLLE